ncbi:MAG: TIGR02117 family protein [Chitinophaga sp.]|uniref:TIGR02117 family protein n=1 Tax=Chitinophaga sp. TaxID=1869181 RepID=UPI001B174D7A|nr:TIGR02117 family protein [Chitinophaga sp.]MBO9728363.1 TIGR02117 family protein [Chitinophaga sp.]
MKRLLKITGYTLLTFFLFIGIYLLSAYTLSRMSTQREVVNDADITIYMLTNGVHTDLVVPVRTPQIDWSRYIPFKNTVGNDTTATLLAFGWGDKGFYLETPTWADLKTSTALKAAFNLSTSAIHATYYRGLTENESCRAILVNKEQYARLISYINNSFRTGSDGQPVNIVTHANYDKNDAFYEAKGSYNLFHTCNTWANNGLKSCGQKACRWTIFDTGIFYQYR